MKILLKNAELLDASRRYEKSDVLIEGSVIDKIGSGLTDDDAVMYDLTGCTLMPGIIDAHVHVAAPDGFAGDALSHWSRSGVTTVRELGMLNNGGLKEFFQDIASCSTPHYTRVITAGKYIDIPGGYGMGPDPSLMVGIAVESPEAAAQAVACQRALGSDGVKIGLTDGAGLGGPRPSMPPEYMKAISNRAQQLGMWFSVHLSRSSTVQTLIDCGATDAAHTPGDDMPDDLIKSAVDAGLAFVTTIGDPHEEPPEFLPEHIRQLLVNRVKDTRGPMLRNLKRIHDAGGVVAMGTDTGVSEHFCSDYSKSAVIPVYELKNLAEAGFELQDVVRSATLDAARVCRIDSEEGSVDSCKRANLIAFRGRLDETFEALKNVPFVMNRGVILKNTLHKGVCCADSR